MPDIEIAGSTYTDVPEINVPKRGGGTAKFYDPSGILYAASPVSGGAATMANGIHWGACDSTSTATAFTAQIPDITEYYEGLTIVLRNGVVASTTNCTLNINGLGALPIYPSTSDTRISTAWAKAYTMIFVYTENKIANTAVWEAQYGMAYSNSIGYQVRTNSQTMPLSDRMYRYRLFFTSADGTKYVPANTSTSTNATASRTTNTTPIDPFGAIFYYAGTTAYAAGNNTSATASWQQYVLTLGYSFNNTGAALTLTNHKPVYLRCTPQADGSAVMDYFTQALPSTNDGKIYIFLGIATSETQIELEVNHPVYYHDGTGIRLWPGAVPSGGGGVENYYVTFSSSGGSWVADKTNAQIAAAVSAGKRVIGTYTSGVYTSYLQLSKVTVVSGTDLEYACFSSTEYYTDMDTYEERMSIDSFRWDSGDEEWKRLYTTVVLGVL